MALHGPPATVEHAAWQAGTSMGSPTRTRLADDDDDDDDAEAGRARTDREARRTPSA